MKLCPLSGAWPALDLYYHLILTLYLKQIKAIKCIINEIVLMTNTLKHRPSNECTARGIATDMKSDFGGIDVCRNTISLHKAFVFDVTTINMLSVHNHTLHQLRVFASHLDISWARISDEH